MKRIILGLAMVGALALPLQPAAAQGTNGFRVVIHPESAVTAVTSDQLAAIYLKRTTRWSDGTPARPVDLPRTVPVRETFSRAVLNRSANAVAAHWQQQIFSGRGVPPTEVASDAAVVAYVRDNPGAVGYVSLNADVRGVRVLEIRP